MENLLKRFEWLVQNRIFSEAVLQEIVNKHDPIVRIDQASTLSYPSFFSELLYPEPRKLDKFDVRKLRAYLHPEQKGDGFVSIETVFDCLRQDKLIEHCLSLKELLAIRERGCLFFQEYFPNMFLLGWRSVAISKEKGDLWVPLLHERGEKVILDWEKTKGNDLLANCPALYFQD